MKSSLTQCEAVIQFMLSRGGTVTTADYCQTHLAASFRSRVSDIHLKPKRSWFQGKRYDIESQRVRQGCWKYTLIEIQDAVKAA